MKRSAYKKLAYLLYQGITQPSQIVPFLLMKTHKLYMLYLSKNSIFRLEKEMSMASLLPKKLIKKIILVYSPNSVLDLGCGTGKSLHYFKKLGVKDVYGVEGSKLAIAHCDDPSHILQYNLEKELDLKKKFDLLFSFEFVEHIHPRYVPALMNTLTKHSDLVILTAALPGSSGQGHFNCQPPQYWISKFAEKDFVFDSEATHILRRTKDIFCENLLVFRKRSSHTI